MNSCASKMLYLFSVLYTEFYTHFCIQINAALYNIHTKNKIKRKTNNIKNKPKLNFHAKL